MQTIKLELDVDDINILLEALGNLPFARVYQLIARIQEQARGQLQHNGQAASMEEGTS